MNKQDAAVIKILSELDMLEDKPLTPKETDILARALDPEKEYLYNVEKLFNNTPSKK